MPHDRDPETHMKVTLLAQGKLADGRDYWAYVDMSPAKSIAFKKALKNPAKPPQPQAYGEVIEWGIGEYVPLDVRERMENDYGANHDFEAQFKNYAP